MSNKKIHHVNTVEDNEPTNKIFREERDDTSSDEEYVLISTLMRTISHGINDWIVVSGAPKQMTRYK